MNPLSLSLIAILLLLTRQRVRALLPAAASSSALCQTGRQIKKYTDAPSSRLCAFLCTFPSCRGSKGAVAVTTSQQRNTARSTPHSADPRSENLDRDLETRVSDDVFDRPQLLLLILPCEMFRMRSSLNTYPHKEARADGLARARRPRCTTETPIAFSI